MTTEAAAFSAPDIPEVPVIPVPECDACGGTARARFAAGRDFELQTCRNEWEFVRCPACDHVWLDPRPAVEALGTIYPPTYYAYDYEATIPRAAQWGKALLDRRKLARVRRAVPNLAGGYLDVGCGTGRYLRAMAAAGLPRERIHGLELDAAVVRRLRDEGFDVHHDRVESCAAMADGSLDLVTMFHVIEHVTSPAHVLARLHRWIAPGGVLAVETPNRDSIDARWFGDRHWGGYHFPRHWHLFTPESLAALLRRHGFEPFLLQFQTGHSFWMYSVHHRLRYGDPAWLRVAKWFDPFKSVGLLAGFTAFDLLRGALGARTSAMLMLARRLPGSECR